MSTDELRTAAIEAIRSDIADLLGDDCTEFGLVSWAEGIVDAVLPLLVAGTASRIADEIEAEANQFKPEDSCFGDGAWYWEAFATFARRMGETS